MPKRNIPIRNRRIRRNRRKNSQANNLKLLKKISSTVKSIQRGTAPTKIPTSLPGKTRRTRSYAVSLPIWIKEFSEGRKFAFQFYNPSSGATEFVNTLNALSIYQIIGLEMTEFLDSCSRYWITGFSLQINLNSKAESCNGQIYMKGLLADDDMLNLLKLDSSWKTMDFNTMVPIKTRLRMLNMIVGANKVNVKDPNYIPYDCRAKLAIMWFVTYSPPQVSAEENVCIGEAIFKINITGEVIEPGLIYIPPDESDSRLIRNALQLKRPTLNIIEEEDEKEVHDVGKLQKLEPIKLKRLNTSVIA